MAFLLRILVAQVLLLHSIEGRRTITQPAFTSQRRPALRRIGSRNCNNKANRATSNDEHHSNSNRPSRLFSTLDTVERIFAISDLHTDNMENLQWLRENCEGKSSLQTTTNEPGPRDVLIIAGDISHEPSRLENTLSIIKNNLKCQIFFVFGNHEAWIGGQEMDGLGIQTSLDKIEVVKEICDKMGVYTNHKLVGAAYDHPVWIAPIESWYDGSLSLDDCDDLTSNFSKWPWVDFKRCVWPDTNSLQGEYEEQEYSTSKSMMSDGELMDITNTGKIPLGLTQHYFEKNGLLVKDIQSEYHKWVEDFEFMSDVMENSEKLNLPGLITFSHFLPNKKTLPDWKDPSQERFQRDWLDHPVPEVSAKFAKVSGTNLIDKQIRSIVPSTLSDYVQHLHVFGHSHRPKDFVTDSVRYIHNPLGKPAERDMNMVSKEVGFQLIWDCTKSSSSSSSSSVGSFNLDKEKHVLSMLYGMPQRGEVPGERIIRFWEEKGGGKDVLARKMKHRRSRRKLEVKRFFKEIDLKKSEQQGPEQ